MDIKLIRNEDDLQAVPQRLPNRFGSRNINARGSCQSLIFRMLRNISI